MSTTPVLTFFNNKGGVGKTSLVYHVSWMLAELLVRLAQEARKPIFALAPADGAIGSHAAASRDAFRDFEELTREIMHRVKRSENLQRAKRKAPRLSESSAETGRSR